MMRGTNVWRPAPLDSGMVLNVSPATDSLVVENDCSLDRTRATPRRSMWCARRGGPESPMNSLARRGAHLNDGLPKRTSAVHMFAGWNSCACDGTVFAQLQENSCYSLHRLHVRHQLPALRGCSRVSCSSLCPFAPRL